PLAIVDIRPRRVPAEDSSLRVAQGLVADQEPPVLPIPAPEASLVFEWHPVRKRLTALLHRDTIVRMEKPTEEVRGRHLLHRESGVLEKGTVRVQDSCIRPQDVDGLGYGVDDAAQLLFVLPKPRFSPLEVFDIGVRSVPVNDIALLVAHRLDADDEPTILAVMATQPYFRLARFRCGKSLAPLGQRAWGIVGMNNKLG